MKKLVLLLLCAIVITLASAQDSLTLPVKISHAEPLYVDLIRDLGARGGEKEWNVGWSSENQSKFVGYAGFVEYEFAPIHRVGLEIEVPVKFYHIVSPADLRQTLKNRVEGIKLAAQYTFFLSDKRQLSLAAVYIHEFRLHSFRTMRIDHTVLKGNRFSPFVVVAKRWGHNIHSLLYTGPLLEKDFNHRCSTGFQVNLSFHYMLPSKHFIGIELNEETLARAHELVARPQIKLALASNLAIGFVTGIPVYAAEYGMSFMTRIIFEPPSKK